MGVKAKGLGKVQKKLEDRASRAGNPKPFLKVLGAAIDKETDDAFDASREVDGKPFKPLRPSTLASRAGRVKSKRIRKAIRGGNAKALVDTGRARNSARTVAKAKTATWSAVKYLEPHMTGARNGRPPRRNPTVFVKKGGGWDFHPTYRPRVKAAYERYLSGGLKAIGKV